MDKPPPFIESFFNEISTLSEFPTPTPHALQTKDGIDHIYRLNLNESAYGPSPNVVNAIQQAVNKIGLYPNMRDDALREKLAEVYQRGLSADNFYSSSSGYEALELVARAFFRPNDEIIITEPTFLVYDRITRLHRAELVNVPLLEPAFIPDVDGILSAITPQTRAVILCNPNNPTGTIMTADDMKHLMEHIPEHVLVICDEVYFHYVTANNFPDTMQYILDGKNIVLVHSFSKGYGMAGMRMGYAITTKTIANYVRKYYRGFHLNSLQLVAGLAALDDPAHLQKNVSAGIAGRQFLYEACDALDLPYWESQTNFVMIDLPCPAKEVVEKMRYHGVLVGRVGDAYPNYLRVSVGTPSANQICIQALETALTEIMS